MVWSDFVREVKRIQRAQRPGLRPQLYNFDLLAQVDKAEAAFAGDSTVYQDFRLYTQWGDRLVERRRIGKTRP